MSIFANLSGTTADFYLAQIDPIHAGKTMRINMFDSGEGASSLQILDPNGNPFPINTSKPAIALCRCGQSKNKPFCDGSHNGCGFQAGELAPAPG